VYGQKEYADAQKDLERELQRLRTELRVPAQDPPETLMKAGKPKGAKKGG